MRRGAACTLPFAPVVDDHGATKVAGLVVVGVAGGDEVIAEESVPEPSGDPLGAPR